jgi:polysaccharide export outer membrane protein
MGFTLARKAIAGPITQEKATMRAIFNLVLGLITGLLLLAAPAQAQSGYGVRAGDVLKVEVLEDPSLNRSVLVAPDGRISVPLAGTFMAVGLSVDQIGSEISKRMAGNFATPPNVFVSLERLAERQPAAAAGGAPAAAATIDIFILGEAAKPGKISVEPGTTVLQLFAQMGGFSKFAATKRIQLRRTDAKTGETSTYLLNYKEIEAGTSDGGRTTLRDGDVILVPQRRLFE